MPAGVPTAVFQRAAGVERARSSVLFLGRISPVKNIECLIDAAKLLHADAWPFTVHIVGSPAVASDWEYEKKLRDAARELMDKGLINFRPAVSHAETPHAYNENELFINLTDSGSFDKSMLEAMSCECLVLASNLAFADILPSELIFRGNDAPDLARKIRAAMSLDVGEKKRLGRSFRQYVVDEHGLERLAQEIREAIDPSAVTARRERLADER